MKMFMFSILQTDMRNMKMKFKVVLLVMILVVVILLVGIVSPITESITGTDVNYNEKVEYDGKNKFTFLSGGSLTVSYNKRNYELSDLSKVDFTENGVSIAKEPQIIFGDNGKIKEAYFTTGRDGEYILGNEILNLQKGTKVIFKEGTALIQIPGEIFQPPRTADNKKGESSFTFFSEGDKGVRFGSYLIKGGLGYEQGNYFIEKQDRMELADLIISNPNHVKTYIDFDGKVNFAYKGSYISMDRENGNLVVGSNTNNPSPAIMVKKENAYGLKFDNENDHFAFQSSGSVDGSYFKIKKNKAGIVPEIEHLNGFVINENGMSFFYDSEKEKLYSYTKGKLIKDFGDTGSSMVATTLTGSFKTKNNRIERTMGDSVLGISNFNEYAFGRNKRFIRLKHYRGSPGFFTGISDLESYNYELTEKGLERITGVQLIASDDSGKSYLNDPKNIRYLYDLFFSIPIEQTRMVKRMHFASSLGFAYGYADSNMNVHFTVGGGATSSGNRLSAGTWRHEMGHIVDFNGGKNGRFDRMWYDSEINSIAITSGYSRKGGERISEFIGNFAYNNKDDYGRSINHLLNSHKDKDLWRAAFAVAWYNHGFSYERIGEIYSQAGLPYDVNSLYGYIRKVGIKI